MCGAISHMSSWHDADLRTEITSDFTSCGGISGELFATPGEFATHDVTCSGVNYFCCYNL